jgi:hypothetical protein
MVMLFDEFLPFFVAIWAANTALKRNPSNFESFWVV